jgi:thiol-disulfide isomerase/thioredoxin
MLEVLLSLGRITLAAVFVVAAIAKLLDREGTRHAVREFGAPSALARPLALVLPVAELAVAALLLPTATAVAGAAGALALLALFSAVIAGNLARGRKPACHCFGQLGSAPAARGTLARNGALAAVAAFVLVASLAEGGVGTIDWAARLSGSEAMAVGLGAALAAFVAAGLRALLTVLRSYGRLLIRVERLEEALARAGYELGDHEDGGAEPLGLEPGTPAPGFELVGTDGDRVSLDDLLAPRLHLVLLFTSPGCGPCEALLPDVASWQSAHAERFSVAVLADGEPAEVRDVAKRDGLRNVLTDAGGELYRSYEAPGTPSAVLVAPDGTIASRLAAGPAAIAELVAGVLDAPGLPVGAPAPALDGLAPLDGRPATLVGGRESVVLFWSPDCGFCRSMHADLLAWEAEANGSSPQLVVVSSGSEERTRAERFASPVLLDPDWSAGAAFGVRGTPSAVLVDPEGRVQSELLVGAEAILGLARGPRLLHVGERG